MEVEDRLRRLTIVKRPESKPAVIVGSNNSSVKSVVYITFKRFSILISPSVPSSHSIIFRKSTKFMLCNQS